MKNVAQLVTIIILIVLQSNPASAYDQGLRIEKQGYYSNPQQSSQYNQPVSQQEQQQPGQQEGPNTRGQRQQEQQQEQQGQQGQQQGQYNQGQHGQGQYNQGSQGQQQGQQQQGQQGQHRQGQQGQQGQQGPQGPQGQRDQQGQQGQQQEQNQQTRPYLIPENTQVRTNTITLVNKLSNTKKQVDSLTHSFNNLMSTLRNKPITGVLEIPGTLISSIHAAISLGKDLGGAVSLAKNTDPSLRKMLTSSVEALYTSTKSLVSSAGRFVKEFGEKLGISGLVSTLEKLVLKAVKDILVLLPSDRSQDSTNSTNDGFAAFSDYADTSATSDATASFSDTPDATATQDISTLV